MPTAYARRPAPSEYVPYYGRYIDKIPDGDVLRLLDAQHEATLRLLSGLSEAEAERRYAPGKWSVKEVIGHVIDTERIFVYRALRFSRNETIALPGYDQNAYVEEAGFDARSLADLLEEFRAVRRATILFFKGLSDEMMERAGTANDAAMSVRAVAYMLAGHERHHVDILRERYLGGTT